jgi:hypothetical protein
MEQIIADNHDLSISHCTNNIADCCWITISYWYITYRQNVLFLSDSQYVRSVHKVHILRLYPESY